jgi:Protein of unknown function (DUF1587)/Planctomycete cytochrome C
MRLPRLLTLASVLRRALDPSLYGRLRWMHTAGLILLLALGASPLAAQQKTGFDSEIKPFLRRNCQGCHNARLESGDLNLARFLDMDQASAMEERDLWERVVQKLKLGLMPPPPVKAPAAQVEGAVRWIESEYARMDKAAGPNPGRVTARRLNRNEYNNTIRDLVGVTIRPADDFPVDQSGYGFDNIGDVLSMSPVLTEKYLKAAREVARAAIVVPQETVPSTVQHHTAEQLQQIGKMHLTVEHDFPADGEYLLRGTFYQALKAGTKLVGRLYLDGKQLSETPLSFYYQMDRAWEAHDVVVTAGRHKVEADLEIEAGYKGSLPYVDSVDVRGPLRQLPPQLTESHKKTRRARGRLSHPCCGGRTGVR